MQGALSDGQENVGSISEGLVTSFTPVNDGLNHNNEFKTVVVANVVTGRLCGGMVYTALDYFYSPKKVPRQNYRPAPGNCRSEHRSHRHERDPASVAFVSQNGQAARILRTRGCHSRRSRARAAS